MGCLIRLFIIVAIGFICFSCWTITIGAIAINNNNIACDEILADSDPDPEFRDACLRKEWNKYHTQEAQTQQAR